MGVFLLIALQEDWLPVVLLTVLLSHAHLIPHSSCHCAYALIGRRRFHGPSQSCLPITGIPLAGRNFDSHMCGVQGCQSTGSRSRRSRHILPGAGAGALAPEPAHFSRNLSQSRSRLNNLTAWSLITEKSASVIYCY